MIYNTKEAHVICTPPDMPENMADMLRYLQMHFSEESFVFWLKYLNIFF